MEGRERNAADPAGPVALDAMGGDYAPQATVAAAIEVAESGIDVILVGPEEILLEELDRSSADGSRRGRDGVASRHVRGNKPQGSLSIVHAPEVVSMGDDPLSAVRRKRRSSVAVAAELAASGEAVGMVSAGSTGAAVAASVFKMGRLAGIQRPGIATVIPFPKRPLVLIDSGANVECDASHLLDFAVMGALYSSAVFGLEKPRVGLLNIGSEDAKGAAVHRRAYRVLAEAAKGPFADTFEFFGNVEGHDLPEATVDVAVTDGFTGNVVLKLCEGLARALIAEIVTSITRHTEGESQRGAIQALLDLRSSVNADGAGGACLLGVGSLAVIAHGSAKAESVAKALRFAASERAAEMQSRIATALEELHRSSRRSAKS